VSFETAPRHAQLPDGRVDIKSLTLTELTRWMGPQGKAEARALQVYKAIWQRGETNYRQISTIPKSLRSSLAQETEITWLHSSARLDSADGTRKYLWRCSDGSTIESVLIPDEDRPGPGPARLTLCISTQVGCAMACTFCLTGDMGLKRNLSPSEIANQSLQVQRDLGPDRKITNVVLMGMGEPLHNYRNLVIALENMLHGNGQNFSHRRITVSTVGLVPALKKLAATLPVNIAVSLNATTEEQRRQVMPITRKYSMAELMSACQELPLPSGKRITFEYVMMEGFNADMADAERLVELMREVPAKVNLIPYNENPDRDIRRPSAEKVESFQNYLMSHGINCSVRVTRGRDISAACGQLGTATERMASRLG
jgi:23S rRNA (adenine2503-C2)-methyltransferase